MRISDWSSDVCSSDLIYRLVSLAKEEGPWRNVTFKPLRRAAGPICRCRLGRGCSTRRAACGGRPGSSAPAARRARRRGSALRRLRSEEHTSELQSLMRISYAVFFLKKKKTTDEK